MKRLLALFLVAIMLLSACKNAAGDTKVSKTDAVGEPQTEANSETGAVAASETAADLLRAEELKALLRENFPRTDGSTSAIPLDAAVRAAIFGITYEEAEAQVFHTTSHKSFYNLLDGKCDFIYCHLLSEAQYHAAEFYGVKVEQIPIAREGFVFIVGRDNPVDSLTVEQIKGIYSGKITNWKEVGGDDMPIIAYQRNVDSGSQNYMTAFMGDTPLMDAPTELRPGNMNTIVDAVASYKPDGGSIGYSVYSYVGGMYDAGGRVKILKVNGVRPSYETIADGSYPCTGYNYVVFRADEPDGSPARNLAEWILTAEGQAAIASTGYFAPLEPVPGVKPTITGLRLYSKKGTGDRKADFCAYYHIADVPTEPLDIEFEDGYSVGVRSYTFDRSRPVTGNAALDKEVANYLVDITARMVSLEFPYDIEEWDPEPTLPIRFDFTAVNGYLSVTVMRGPYYTVGAMWDIETGKRLAFSDLFESGTEFINTVNERLNSYFFSADEFISPGIETKRPFVGVESEFSNFALRKTYSLEYDRHILYLCLYFNSDDSSYFSRPYTFGISVRGLPGCLLSNARDMSGYFESRHNEYWFNENIEIRKVDFVSGATFHSELRWYDIVGYPGAQRINEAQYRYLSENYDVPELAWSDEAVAAALEYMRDILLYNYGIENPTRNDLTRCRVVIEAKPFFFGDRYVAISYLARSEYDDSIGYGGGIINGRHMALYDLLTGDQVDFSAVLVDGRLRGTLYSPDRSSVISENAVMADTPCQIIVTPLPPHIEMYFETEGTPVGRLVPCDDSLVWFK
ncbi:MAG: PstS family phosphate ABC transporter substrate-binding protein [Eubacteriales bacterium]|nr:hypothetical protein [Clostridiales bacterium]